MDSVPSQSLCYPAKLVHRHVADLLSRGIKRVFYPILLRESQEKRPLERRFNCPVVVDYPDVAALNAESELDFMRPSFPFDYAFSGKKVAKRLYEGRKPWHIWKKTAGGPWFSPGTPITWTQKSITAFPNSSWSAV